MPWLSGQLSPFFPDAAPRYQPSNRHRAAPVKNPIGWFHQPAQTMPTETSPFVITTQPRSGSYHFKSLLDSAEDIVCQGEIFKESAVEVDCHL